MKITRTSILTGETRTIGLPVTLAQLNDWHQGTLIQNAMPNLTPDEREFIKTGITEGEWEEAFADE